MKISLTPNKSKLRLKVKTDVPFKEESTKKQELHGSVLFGDIQGSGGASPQCHCAHTRKKLPSFSLQILILTQN